MYAQERLRLAWKKFIGDTEISEYTIVNDGEDNLSIHYKTMDGVDCVWSIPMEDLYA